MIASYSARSVARQAVTAGPASYQPMRLGSTTGLAISPGARAGAGGQSLGANGFRFKNTRGKPGGLVQGTLKPGANASVQWKGRGANLPALGCRSRSP
jgi:hypothetical protein